MPGVKLMRFIAYLMACAAFALSSFAYFEYIYGLGFPDGFISELGYAERTLAYVFIIISVATALYFVYLGKIAGRKLIKRQFLVAGLLYLAFIVVIVMVDRYFSAHLTGSAGG